MSAKSRSRHPQRRGERLLLDRPAAQGLHQRRLSTTMQIQFEPGRVDSNFTDTIVRLHYDPALGYGVDFYGDRADTLFAQWLAGYLKASVWDALNAAHRQHPEWNRSDMEDFRKAMAARLSSRMRDLRRERDAEFAAAATSQGTGVALVLVTDKLAKRDAEFGSPKYKHSRITVRDQMAAHKGSLAGDQVGFAKPIRSAQGHTGG